MLRRTPHDPTKPPRIFSRGMVVVILAMAILAITSRLVYAHRIKLPDDGLTRASVLVEAGARWTDVGNGLAFVRMRCLCRDGKYAEREVPISIAPSSLCNPSYSQIASRLNARAALAQVVGLECPVPFLRNFRVGYNVSYEISCEGAGHSAAFAELENWIRSGELSLMAPCGPIAPPAVRYTTPLGDFRPPVSIYPPHLLFSALAGIVVVYLSPVVCAVLIWRTMRTWKWHRRVRRGQCVRCKYSLAGIPSDVCPECSTPRVSAKSPARRADRQ